MLRLATSRFAVTLSAAALALTTASAREADTPGAVYALTNDIAGNAVLVYDRAHDGGLTFAGSYGTGGAGTGAGLNSQGAVIVDDAKQLLFAVNARSSTISSFRIGPNGLALADQIASGGTMPTSVAYKRGLLYVLNAGTPNNLTGFTVSEDGTLASLPQSTRPLSADATAPAQVGFSENGQTVIVTERSTNRVDTYAVGSDGRLTGPFVHTSAGPTPYGFAVDRQNTLFVSEAGAGGGASSYRIGEGSGLIPVSSMLMTGQRAACWAVVTKNGRFGYVTNAGSGSISGFAIAHDGAASLLGDSGVVALTGGNPTDMALSNNGRYLYVRVSGLRRIAVFEIGSDGSLHALPPLDGTPTTMAGLAAY